MRNRQILLILMAALMLSSCASRKHFVYLRDMKADTRYPVVEKYEAIIHQDDRLAITVNSKLPELRCLCQPGERVPCRCRREHRFPHPRQTALGRADRAQRY